MEALFQYAIELNYSTKLLFLFLLIRLSEYNIYRNINQEFCLLIEQMNNLKWM